MQIIIICSEGYQLKFLDYIVNLWKWNEWKIAKNINQKN